MADRLISCDDQHLSPEMRRKLARDNAAALYGLG